MSNKGDACMVSGRKNDVRARRNTNVLSLLMGLVLCLMTMHTHAHGQTNLGQTKPLQSPLLFASSHSTPVVPRILKIGIEGANPPFHFLDKKRNLKGFEVDFGLELCRRIKENCLFERKDWDRLLPALTTQKVDFIISSLAITEEPSEPILFSLPYYRIPAAFMVEKNLLPFEVSPLALKGKTIGTLATGSFQEYLQALYPQSILRTYANVEEAYLDALSDRIDVFFADRLSLQKFSRTSLGNCCVIVGKDHDDPAFFGAGIGVGLRAQDIELKKRIDDQILAMKRDGTLERLRKPYFIFSLQ
jgi:polar amino acid transport system substrate-binding protein